MAFPGFKFQKFSGGECPRTPLIMRGFGVRHGQGFRLDPRLDQSVDNVHVAVPYTNWVCNDLLTNNR